MRLEASNPPRQRRRGPLNGYVLFWSLLALGALGYLGVVATRPDLIIARLAPGEPQTAEPTAVERRTSEIADELLMLRRWLTDLQRDFAETRATVVQKLGEEHSLAARVSTIEERLTVQEAKVEAAAADPPEPAKGAKPAPNTKAAAVAKATPPAKAAAPAERAAEPAVQVAAPAVRSLAEAPIATGSIAAPDTGPIPFGAAKVTLPSAGRQIGIELSGGESLEALRLSWGQLADQHKQVLGRLAPRYRTAAKGENDPLRLVAGPFASPAEATRACAALRSKQVHCRVGEFIGNAL